MVLYVVNAWIYVETIEILLKNYKKQQKMKSLKKLKKKKKQI